MSLFSSSYELFMFWWEKESTIEQKLMKGDFCEWVHAMLMKWKVNKQSHGWKIFAESWLTKEKEKKIKNFVANKAIDWL